MSIAQRELTVLLTDLYLAADLRESLPDPLCDAPRLPVLERILARASTRERIDWHTLALRITDTGLPPPVPVAAISRSSGAGTAAAGGQWWVASAVHLQAGHDHVQLAQVLSLSPAEWSQLQAQFNQTFGAHSGTLECGHDSEAYLRTVRPFDARGVDPERVSGGDVHDFLPEGADGAAVRRLMTEVQMWLHEHPLNVARAARRAAPVSGLWLWGSGSLPQLPAGATLPALVTDDWFLRGLWVARGVPGAAAAPTGAITFDSVTRALERTAHGCVVGLALRDQSGATWLERLASLDRAWLLPAFALLRTGKIAVLRLQVSDVLFTLQARDVWRVWRRPRSWVEALA